MRGVSRARRHSPPFVRGGVQVAAHNHFPVNFTLLAGKTPPMHDGGDLHAPLHHVQGEKESKSLRNSSFARRAADLNSLAPRRHCSASSSMSTIARGRRLCGESVLVLVPPLLRPPQTRSPPTMGGAHHHSTISTTFTIAQQEGSLS
ncbi:hypothetical protein E2C01_080375 [Portunus trituberculatus]|uniref:Uncharacterized protein n=1 Tax=Portunus trituberculatus TaxID=210409 RepID=A0A5B7IZF7_PORTR|nr:hypothetical protein [Portunus trituberculatus]